MKSLTDLLREVLLDCGTWCGVSTTRDFKTVTSRIECEGLSFLTITLPNFGADLQKGLDQGYVDTQLFHGFERVRGKGDLPRFLSGFLCLVFDASTCRLLPDPSIEAIRAIRQITLMFAKINLPCSNTRVRAAITKFLQCEKDIRSVDRTLNSTQKAQFLRTSNMLWSETLQTLDESIYYGRLIPKHGPGSTADKLLGNKKYMQRQWTSRLEPLFPHGEYLASSWRQFQTDLSGVELLEPGMEVPVKVISVPKTLKTPRIIAVEPTCMQYTQQAISAELVKLLERNNYPLEGFIGFSNQIPNQEMARIGSLDGTLATLDLSEASDRVSNQLVRIMCTNFPHVSEGFDATRSRKADVPGTGVIRIAKFASMGSALCFPVEAMVFLTITFMGIENVLRRRLTRKDLKGLKGRVRVYGDDIIVPVEYAESVAAVLETFGLLVNHGKSFWTGMFRESCGKEYFDGHDISIVRVRQALPTQRSDTPGLLSTISTRNQFYSTGYWRVAGFFDGVLRELDFPFPIVEDTSPVQGRVSFLSYIPERFHPLLQSPQVRGLVVKNIIPLNPLGDYGALLKCFLLRGREPSSDVKHLERSGRPKSVYTETRWAQPF